MSPVSRGTLVRGEVHRRRRITGWTYIQYAKWWVRARVSGTIDVTHRNIVAPDGVFESRQPERAGGECTELIGATITHPLRATPRTSPNNPCVQSPRACNRRKRPRAPVVCRVRLVSIGTSGTRDFLCFVNQHVDCHGHLLPELPTYEMIIPCKISNIE